MSLVQLVYFSRPSHELQADDVVQIKKIAATTNSSSHITGYLLYTPEWFVQVLEGSPQAVNRVYGRIVADTRHHDPVLLGYRQVSQRSFAPWSMGVCLYEQLRKDVFLKYGPGPQLDPRRMGVDGMVALLEELARGAGDR